MNLTATLSLTVFCLVYLNDSHFYRPSFLYALIPAADKYEQIMRLFNKPYITAQILQDTALWT